MYFHTKGLIEIDLGDVPLPSNSKWKPNAAGGLNNLKLIELDSVIKEYGKKPNDVSLRKWRDAPEEDGAKKSQAALMALEKALPLPRQGYDFSKKDPAGTGAGGDKKPMKKSLFDPFGFSFGDSPSDSLGLDEGEDK